LRLREFQKARASTASASPGAGRGGRHPEGSQHAGVIGCCRAPGCGCWARRTDLQNDGSAPPGCSSAERPLLTRTLPHPKMRDREGREVAACHLSSGMHIVRILTNVFAWFGPQERRTECVRVTCCHPRWLQAVLLHGTQLVGCRHRLRGETPCVFSAGLRCRWCRVLLDLQLSDISIAR
jgi:hypothetical protein